MDRPKTLSAAFVRTISKPGRYGDGRGGYGLSLLVRNTANGRLSKTWSQRVRVNGKATNIGLGGWPVVSLADARQKALENRRSIAQGLDPRGGSVPDFESAVESVIAIHAEGWKDGGRTASKWRSQMDKYASQLARKQVDQITAADVLAVLAPIWHSKPEIARRTRQRISAVMRWAIAQGHRPDNPAGEAVAAALPKQDNRTRHHRAIPHAEVSDAIAAVQASSAWLATKLALEFLVLTACRSGEVRNATWDEVDLDSAVWEVPEHRSKTGRPHRVPLSGRALEVLDEALNCSDGSNLLFPSVTGKPLSNATMGKLLRESGIDCVPHGMRTSFRMWAAECTSFPREVCELALGHVNKDRVEAAYQRSDLFDKRRDLMAAWAEYLEST